MRDVVSREQLLAPAGEPRWFVAGPHGYQVCELSLEHPSRRELVVGGVARLLLVRESEGGPEYTVMVLRPGPGRWSSREPTYSCSCDRAHCLHVTAVLAFCGGPTDGPVAGARRAVA